MELKTDVLRAMPMNKLFGMEKSLTQSRDAMMFVSWLFGCTDSEYDMYVNRRVSEIESLPDSLYSLAANAYNALDCVKETFDHHQWNQNMLTSLASSWPDVCAGRRSAIAKELLAECEAKSASITVELNKASAAIDNVMDTGSYSSLSAYSSDTDSNTSDENDDDHEEPATDDSDASSNH